MNINILNTFWQSLCDGCINRHSDYHLMTIGYCRDDTPHQSTVVLRGSDPSEQSLSFHTDFRSSKIDSLAKSPKLSSLFYSKVDKCQLKLTGIATIHHRNALTEQRWQQARPMSKVCYQQKGEPGSLFSAKKVIKEESDGYDNFAVISLQVEQIDILLLNAKGNRRFIKEALEGNDFIEVYP